MVGEAGTSLRGRQERKSLVRFIPRIFVFLLGTALLGCSAPADKPTADNVDQRVPADRPVEKEISAYRADFEKKFSERGKVYDEGVAEVGQSGVLASAIKVGEMAPDFDLPNASGEKVKLSDLLARGPVVLTWYRGGWCPYCNIQLRGFQKELPELTAAGATLVAVSPETPDNTATTMEKNELKFVVLSDKGNVAARMYGITYRLPQKVAEQFKGRIDLAKFNGDDSNELPLAATYVIDTDGVIRWAFVDKDYRKRAEPKDVLDAVRKLKSENDPAK